MIKAENIRFDTTIKGQALRSMDEHFSYASNASRESLLLNLGRAFLVSKKHTENQKHQLIRVLNKVGLLLPPIDVSWRELKITPRCQYKSTLEVACFGCFVALL